MNLALRRLFRIAWLFYLSILLAGCANNLATNPEQLPVQENPVDIHATAAAQATAIIQRAQATALVLEAQSQANQIIAEAGKTLVPTSPATQAPNPGLTASPSPTNQAVLEVEQVEIVRVSYAAEGGFIIVDYKASPDVADTFWPGVLSITDENTGTVYNEVPVMPKIGPMITRPVTLDQVGYILFVNPPPGLPRGNLVTVKLAKFTFEHIIVE